MNFDEQIMQAAQQIKDRDFIELHAEINNTLGELDVDIMDGFNHTWFLKTYKFKDNSSTKLAILDKLMNDTQEFDMYEELENCIKSSDIYGMPCTRTMCKIAFSLEHFTNELYWQLKTLASVI